jgi:hypothetical protein
MTDIACQSMVFECEEPSTHAYFGKLAKMVIYRCDKHRLNTDVVSGKEISEISFEEAALYEVMND